MILCVFNIFAMFEFKSIITGIDLVCQLPLFTKDDQLKN